MNSILFIKITYTLAAVALMGSGLWYLRLRGRAESELTQLKNISSTSHKGK
jgi:hypothetical protein